MTTFVPVTERRRGGQRSWSVEQGAGGENHSMRSGNRLSMNSSLRRTCIGALSGVAASAVLLPTLHYGLVSLVLGGVIGAAYSVAEPPTRGAYADQLMTGGSLGVPLWGLISVIAIPLLSGRMPGWSADQMRQHFPALIGWVVYGAMLGVIHQGLDDITKRLFGPELVPKPPSVKVSKRIVILGGGFAGMHTAECLEQKLGEDFSVGLTLVNETNALLFTPMLAEVAGSSLEPSHISTPLRSTLRRTEFVRGVVTEVDRGAFNLRRRNRLGLFSVRSSLHAFTAS